MSCSPTLIRPRLEVAETALRQIADLGFRIDDVRHIVPTHLDLDHAGGLADFPEATVHVHAAELRAANNADLAGAHPLPSGPALAGDELAAARGGRRRLVRLRERPGAARNPRRRSARSPCPATRAAIAAWRSGRLGLAPPLRRRLFPSCRGRARGRRRAGRIRAFESLVNIDKPPRIMNQKRLRELTPRHGDEVQLISSHDPFEFAACRRLTTLSRPRPPARFSPGAASAASSTASSASTKADGETARPFGARCRELGRDGEMDMRGDEAGQRIGRNRGVGRGERAERAAGRRDPRQQRAAAADPHQHRPAVDPPDRVIDGAGRRDRGGVGQEIDRGRNRRGRIGRRVDAAPAAAQARRGR